MEAKTSDDTATRTGLRFWVGIAVVLLATGYIVTSSMANTVHYRDVSEVLGETAFIGETMRLRGFVVDGSHQLREGTMDEHVFLLVGDQETITVRFTGAVPDQFQDGASIVATGALIDGETFVADGLTAQCPSRYENEAPTADY